SCQSSSALTIRPSDAERQATLAKMSPPGFAFAAALLSRRDHQSEVFKPRLTELKPDAITSTDSSVALVASVSKKPQHALLFVRLHALAAAFLVNPDADTHAWLAIIIYAAAFLSTLVLPSGIISSIVASQRNRFSRALP
ncbi:hypothetical protein CDV57_09716, partial [Aspergillus fumigatus]